MQKLLIILILIITLIILMVVFKKQIKKILYEIYSLLKDIIKAIFNTILNNKNIKSFFDKHYKIKNFITDRFNLKSKYGLRLTAILTVLTACISWFYSIGENYIHKELVFQFDIRLKNLFFFLRDNEMIKLFTFITNFADPKIIVIGALLFSGFLFLNKKKEYLIPFFTSIGSASILDYILKNIFDRPRPNIGFYIEHGFSFPSGHSTISVAFFGFICYFLIRNTKKLSKKIIYIISSILFIVAICFSRIYLEAHYLSDVMAGFLLGSFSLFIAIGISELFFIKNNEEKINCSFKNCHIFYISFLILVILFSLIFKHEINPINITFTNNINMQYVNSGLYKEFDKNNIPKYSEKLSGSIQEPISFIILAKNDNELLNLFNKANWQLARKPNLKSLLIVANAAIKNQSDPTGPMTPSFWNTQVHDFGFEKATQENTARKRHHARFWKTNIIIDNKNVYIGTASFDVGVKMGITHKIAPDIDTEKEFLFNDLNSSSLIIKYNKQPFVSPTLGKNLAGDEFFTDGEAYLIEI